MQWKRNETAFPTKKTSSSNNSWNLCSNSCFLFEKRACEGGCQGAPGSDHRRFVSPCAGTFFLPVFAILFSHKIVIFNENGPQNGPHIGLFWELFSEKERKQKSAFRLHRRVRIACEPSSWNAKGNAKSFQKARRIPGPFFSRNNLKNDEN